VNTVYFNLLKYVHSAFLGEEVNVGILLYFPEQRQLVFRYSHSFRRLRLLYPTFSERLLRDYLSAFYQRVAQTNDQPEFTGSVEQYASFITQCLLAQDSGALQFGPLRQAVAHSNNAAEVARHYYELFFPEVAPVRKKHDDTFLKQQFRSLLRVYDPRILPLLEKDRVIKTTDVEVKFDFAWQNGALNLVKPLSFDLLDRADINRKSVHCYGWLNLLADEARTRNYQFDLLVAKPANRRLFSEYDQALKILEESSAPKRVIVEEALEAYTEQAAQALREHNAGAEVAE
jgi:hypothetical protein